MDIDKDMLRQILVAINHFENMGFGYIIIKMHDGKPAAIQRFESKGASKKILIS